MDPHLTPDEILCRVCQGILIKPIKLPCNHLICLDCLEQICESSNLTCPMCRKRLSIWLRKNKNFSCIVNEPLWIQIQTEFKDEVEKKLNGQDDGLYEKSVLPTARRQLCTTPGEFKEECNKLIAKMEEEKSLLLIQQLEKEEEEARRRDEEKRLTLSGSYEEYVRQLMEIEKSIQDPVVLDVHTPVTRNRARLSHSASVGKSSKRTRQTPSTSSSASAQSRRKSATSVDGNRSGGSAAVGSNYIPIDAFCIRASSPTMFARHTPPRSMDSKKTSKSAVKRKSMVTASGGPLDSFYTRESSANKRRCTTSSPTSSRASSPDSIECEMNYFKPIKLVPKTPPKLKETQGQPIIVVPRLPVTPINNNATKPCTNITQSSPDAMDIDSTTNTRTNQVTNINQTALVDLEVFNQSATSTACSSNQKTPSSKLSSSIIESSPMATLNPAINSSLNPDYNSSPLSSLNPANNSSLLNPLLRSSSLGNNQLILNSASHWSRSPSSSSNQRTPCKSATIESRSGLVTNSNVLTNNKESMYSSNNDNVARNINNLASNRMELDRYTATFSSQSKNLTAQLNSTQNMDCQDTLKDSLDSNSDMSQSNRTQGINNDVDNRQETQHFFNEFKKISLTQSQRRDESETSECFSQILAQKFHPKTPPKNVPPVLWTSPRRNTNAYNRSLTTVQNCAASARLSNAVKAVSNVSTRSNAFAKSTNNNNSTPSRRQRGNARVAKSDDSDESEETDAEDLFCKSPRKLILRNSKLKMTA
uniref:RING-type E3 ubiquitin transferase n=1 Tax=Cacopsylla melanoneura TaxID=428564 RepID=A0A8D8SGF5_9HEMI